MSDQNKNRAAMAAADISLSEEDLAGAVSRPEDSSSAAKPNVFMRTPLSQRIAERIADKDESPAGQMKLMVEQSRAALAELDDKRIKLESYREVQIDDAQASTEFRRQANLTSIAELEKRIAVMLADNVQCDADGKARIIKINADVDIQVDAIDQMEAWHRNVVEGAARNITPRKGKAKKDDDDLPF